MIKGLNNNISASHVLGQLPSVKKFVKESGIKCPYLFGSTDGKVIVRVTLIRERGSLARVEGAYLRVHEACVRLGRKKVESLIGFSLEAADRPDKSYVGIVVREGGGTEAFKSRDPRLEATSCPGWAEVCRLSDIVPWDGPEIESLTKKFGYAQLKKEMEAIEW